MGGTSAPNADARVTLGVSAGASQAEIKAAWQRYAQKHHPDRGGDNAAFQRGRAAYEALKC
jgi:curved DNA-binding protein CbpA